MPVHSRESTSCCTLCLHWKSKQTVCFELSFHPLGIQIRSLSCSALIGVCKLQSLLIEWMWYGLIYCLTWSQGNLFLFLAIGFILHPKAFLEALSWLWFYCCVPFVLSWQIRFSLYLLTIRKLIMYRSCIDDKQITVSLCVYSFLLEKSVRNQKILTTCTTFWKAGKADQGNQ